jgi:hypothetical protein
MLENETQMEENEMLGSVVWVSHLIHVPMETTQMMQNNATTRVYLFQVVNRLLLLLHRLLLMVVVVLVICPAGEETGRGGGGLAKGGRIVWGSHPFIPGPWPVYARY